MSLGPNRRGERTGWLRLWFGLEAPVGRRAYLLTGVGLMALKYAVDASVIALVARRVWTPLDYLSPFLATWQRAIGSAPDWLFWALVVWTLPFVWIGLGMSVRRAADAGLSPWVGFLFLVPILNYAMMLLLAALPTRDREAWRESEMAPALGSIFRSALIAIGFSLVVALVSAAFSVYVLRSYGLALLAWTPLMMGTLSALSFNRPEPRSLGATLVVALLSILVACFVVLLFAFEGIVCVAMALPLAIPLGVLGCCIGRAIALRTPASTMASAAFLLALPGAALVETNLERRELHEVRSSIEVDAPREVVWRHVVSFGELPPPEAWLFRHGIAYPVRARIEGSGVGALRLCEFSTGAFVEPITAWDEPARLSFDVVDEPPPLVEWSWRDDVRPPHLDGYFASRRGEFRLVELDGGRTRLEGSTWYELAMEPRGYWNAWTDAIVRAIHERVLEHVARLAEADFALRATSGAR